MFEDTAECSHTLLLKKLSLFGGTCVVLCCVLVFACIFLVLFSHSLFQGVVADDVHFLYPHALQWSNQLQFRAINCGIFELFDGSKASSSLCA